MAIPGPIRRVVIFFKENHAFDNYFGTFPGANGATMAHSPNPPTHDPNHTHKGWLNRATSAVRQQFLESDIPAYFAYARQFTLCDNYFTDVAGPSTPNHLMVLTADSPIIDNPHGNPVYDLTSLPASLDAAGLTWGNYGGYAFGMIKACRTVSTSPRNRLRHHPPPSSQPGENSRGYYPEKCERREFSRRRDRARYRPGGATPPGTFGGSLSTISSERPNSSMSDFLRSASVGSVLVRVLSAAR